VFEKGATENFTREIFTVETIKVKEDGVIMYGVKDSRGEIFKGLFYTYELRAV